MKPRIVVVVDDSMDDRYILRRRVEKAGIEGGVKFVEFCAGDEFLEALRSPESVQSEIGETPPPMLVFLDINMPRVSGFEVLEALRERMDSGQLDGRVLIVMMYSSSELNEDQREALSHEVVVDFVVKPVSNARLEEVFEVYSTESGQFPTPVTSASTPLRLGRRHDGRPRRFPCPSGARRSAELPQSR